jgi:hypothetical protein
MDGVLAANGYLAICREGQVLEKWSEIVGARLAEVSECTNVENGILYVRVPSAPWRQEMSFFKEKILSQIHAQTKCRTIKDIVFS